MSASTDHGPSVSGGGVIERPIAGAANLVASTSAWSDLHPLNEVSSGWQNPWHKEPPRWKALRGSTSTDEQVAAHQAVAAQKIVAGKKLHVAALAHMAGEREDRAAERANYETLSFIDRGFHASKPHLRAADPAAASAQ